MATHPLLVEAAKHTAQARAINDEFEGKPMPAEAAREMEGHLAKAADYRARVTREAALVESEEWIREPQYKHDMTHGTKIAEGFGHGRTLVGEQAKEARREAFLRYVRKGAEGLTMEQKAALIEDATGQNLVPTDFAGTILKELPRLSTIRGLASVRPTNSNKVDVASIAINTAGWGKIDGNANLAANDGLAATPAAKQTITVHDLTAMVMLGRDELEDADADLEGIIRDALTLKFAEVEDDAFAAGTGDGANMPFSVVNGVTQNVNAAVDNTPTPDDLKKLTFAVPVQFRQRGVFLWHSKVEQAVALMKDNNGNYLLQNRPSEAEPGRFMGYRWYTVDGLPDPATAGVSQKSVVFGDLANGYLICDRRGITVQRLVERYAETGKVGLLFTKRVGADVIRPKALATYTL